MNLAAGAAGAGLLPDGAPGPGKPELMAKP